ncbi:unnamed protein product, partial [Brassica rapa subsp. narinosa]
LGPTNCCDPLRQRLLSLSEIFKLSLEIFFIRSPVLSTPLPVTVMYHVPLLSHTHS